MKRAEEVGVPPSVTSRVLGKDRQQRLEATSGDNLNDELSPCENTMAINTVPSASHDSADVARVSRLGKAACVG